MKLAALIFVAVLLAFAAAGCGGDHYQKEKIGRGYAVSDVPYHGGTLYCVTRSSTTKDNWTVVAPSCDFVQFHHTYGWNQP
jgi:hypothetical protein